MIKHIVMWKLKEDLAEGKEENALLIKKYLEALPEKVSVIRSLEVGININPSGAAYDVVLYSEFADEQDLETYQKHPDHVQVGEFVGRVTMSRVVVDYLVA